MKSPAPTVEEVPWFYPVSAIWEELFGSFFYLAKSKESDKECGLWELQSFFRWLPVYVNLGVTLQSQAFNYSWLMADLTNNISSKT